MSEKALARAGELKKELVRFSQGQRFAKEMKREVRRRFGDPAVLRNEAEATRFMDWFILEHVLGDGKTILDKFVRKKGDLSPLDKEMLLRWKEVVEGLFEVEERKEDGLLLRDLLDDCRYVAKSNIGPWTLAAATPGSFLATRLMPLEDYWMLSGISDIFPSSERGVLYQLAYEYRIKNPSTVFKRNAAKLKQAWELQAEYRAAFIAFFGSDLVVVRGAQAAQKWSDFNRYRTFDWRGKDGLTAAERARQLNGVTTPSLPKFTLPGDLTGADTVGIIFDEKEGLYFYPDFGLFQEAFERPELANESKYQEVIRGYLKSDSISTLPFRRMAQTYPSNSESVLGAITGKPDFQLENDFEKLMRRYKRTWLGKPVYPFVMPLESDMSRAIMEARSAEAGQQRGLSPTIERFLREQERQFRKE